MAQGYAERLVPPNDGGLFGSFHTQNIWNNAFNPTALLRHTPQQDENAGGKNHSYLVKHIYDVYTDLYYFTIACYHIFDRS